MTRERRVSGVNAGVNIKFTFPDEILPAIYAGEALLSAVHFEVLQQALLLDERPTTGMADERALAAADPNNALTGALAHEGLATVAADVRRLASVHPEVHVQADLICTRFSAELASELGLAGSMAPNVGIEQPLVGESSAAVLA